MGGGGGGALAPSMGQPRMVCVFARARACVCVRAHVCKLMICFASNISMKPSGGATIQPEWEQQVSRLCSCEAPTLNLIFTKKQPHVLTPANSTLQPPVMRGFWVLFQCNEKHRKTGMLLFSERFLPVSGDLCTGKCQLAQDKLATLQMTRAEVARIGLDCWSI